MILQSSERVEGRSWKLIYIDAIRLMQKFFKKQSLSKDKNS